METNNYEMIHEINRVGTIIVSFSLISFIVLTFVFTIHLSTLKSQNEQIIELLQQNKLED